MNCPRHQKELAHQHAENHSLHRCPECEGVWLPGETIDVLLGSGEKLKLRSLCSARESDLTCPNDGHKLGEGKVGGVTVDFCLHCNGLWLDAGELETLRKRKPIAPYKAPEKDAVLFPNSDSDIDSEIALFFATGIW